MEVDVSRVLPRLSPRHFWTQMVTVIYKDPKPWNLLLIVFLEVKGQGSLELFSSRLTYNLFYLTRGVSPCWPLERMQI